MILTEDGQNIFVVKSIHRIFFQQKFKHVFMKSGEILTFEIWHENMMRHKKELTKSDDFDCTRVRVL